MTKIEAEVPDAIYKQAVELAEKENVQMKDQIEKILSEMDSLEVAK